MMKNEVIAMIESRLFKIIYHLMEKGQATAPELAEKFEVSVRTIYRDIDRISGAGCLSIRWRGEVGEFVCWTDLCWRDRCFRKRR